MARGGKNNGNFVRGAFSRGGGSRGNWRGRGNFRGRGRGRGGSNANGVTLQTEDGDARQSLLEAEVLSAAVDEQLGFARLSEGPSKTGWLVNMHATLLRDDTHPNGRSAVDYYFIEEDGSLFKSTVLYEPYFFLVCRVRGFRIAPWETGIPKQKGTESQVEEWLMKRFEGLLLRIERKRKEDLKMPNHLLGYRRTCLQLIFTNMNDFFAVRRELLPIVNKNKENLDAIDAYAEVVGGEQVEHMDIDFGNEESMAHVPQAAKLGGKSQLASDFLIDIREYDVQYCLRVAIDKDIRVGLWYTVNFQNGETSISCISDRVERNDPVVLAFDIETTKAPLKFPDAAHDQIMMISYMVDGQGYLITNREIVSEDIEDFEYTPKPEYEGPFTIFNEASEVELLKRFFEHWREVRPTVVATYNGDFFDFPFVEARAKAHGIDLKQEIGFLKNTEGNYESRQCAHMDCFAWVKRDSYLPQGSQGLKAVTTAKLGYNPDELDPELMTPYAIERPHVLAQYSVSDAVATYYLYMKYVHPFIFSLCNIIPLNPDEVLRKGSGTLCETLLMVEAYRGEVLMPNRHVEPHGNMFDGHLLESETYVGGHVEALEAGVFRSDIATDFKMVPAALDQLISELDDALKFAIVQENNVDLDDVANYDAVKLKIQGQLEALRDTPVFQDKPLIYHLDVAAMYPNIMLSNRLQPDSVVSEAMCAACDYNRPGKSCDRRLTWAWRGEYFPAKLDEFKMVRNALESETFPPKWPGRPERRFVDLTPAEQTSLLHKRLGDYSRKVYKKTHDTKILEKEAIICQRENPFYIDTVRAFRDRRYTYKGLLKDWKRNLDSAESLTETVEAKKMIVLYDSLQLAHKCILNSFYGYVMRKGARWHSMEMAGITCLTGAHIIQLARQLVEQIGRPLELDTDGIWCMLPAKFPDNFSVPLKNGKKLKLSYPCTMLNHLVHGKFTNHQYHTLTDPARGTYTVSSENSIFFELDGPYRAMILPSSKEEDKLLKKRYAVFNEDGSLAELKGFEVKRRGELQLIKIFQSTIFENFLDGTTLQECYASVASVADKWLDVLQTRAKSLPDEELVELIAENRSMSKTLSEYAGQKSTSISTAKRLAEFLGENMVKDKGLACKFIISAKPHGAPVTERAVPVAIFTAELETRKVFLRKWLKDQGLTSFDLRDILDWQYYIERLGSVIQKLITIPAALQKIANPVPRIHHPDWLARRVANLTDKFKQHKLSDMFAAQQQATVKRAEAGLAPVEQKEYIQIGQIRKPKPTVAIKAASRADEPLPTGPAPDFEKDYSGWLRHMKPFWRKKQAEMAAATAAGQSLGGRRGLLSSMMRARTADFSNTTWEIVQVGEVANRPGEFRLWLLIRDSLQSVKLYVPRQFYLNLKKIPTDYAWPASCYIEEIQRTLPRGQKPMNLVRLTVPEFQFRQEEVIYSDLLNRPEVDGIYEMQLPLLVRGLLTLGKECVPATNHGLSKGLDKGFELEELKRPASHLTRRRYLDSGRSCGFAYLYHASSDSRQFLALVSPKGKTRVWIVERGSNREAPSLERYYAEQLSALRAKGTAAFDLKSGKGAFDYPESMKAETTFHASEDVAFRSITRELNAMAKEQLGPTILVAYSPASRNFLEDRLSGAMGAFPLLCLAGRPSDGTFSALGWRKPAGQRFVQHYLRLSSHLKNTLEMADTFDLPLCNFPRDEATWCADMDFARRIVKTDGILWWSPGNKPDLAGKELDSTTAGAEEVLPEISKTGVYANASLELELRDLCVDAILQSALVYELEGSTATGIGIGDVSHNLDEYAKGEDGKLKEELVLGDLVLPASTFALLKTMVKSWWHDSGRPGAQGKAARKVLDHLWRWLASPSANMYDPALCKFVTGLMRKTFSQLLAEFRRLGADVVYANFGRLFLMTGKPTPNMAYAYANYVVSSVNAREIFKYITLEITQHWDILLWMDSANFGGVTCADPLFDDGPDATAEERAKIFAVDMNWNISSFLPPALRKAFNDAVFLFIQGIKSAKQQALESHRSPLRVLQNTLQTQADPNKVDQSDLVKSFVQHKLTRSLLRMVQELQRQHASDAPDEELRVDWEFPDLPGRYLKMQNPILEGIKFICAVLSLAKEQSTEVGVLRRNLLDMINVREFSPQATFKNPAMPFRLDLVCPFCTAVRMFDLTRDADLLVPLPPGEKREFRCLRCSHSHDPEVIEASLLDQTSRAVTNYQVNDLKCDRCKSIKPNSLALWCDCSGGFQNSAAESKNEVVKRLDITLGVAKWFSFDGLQEYCSEVKKHL